MSTAVTAAGTTGTGGDARKTSPSPDGPQPEGFQVYKPGEGYTTRIGMMGVVAAYVGFAAWHWYYNWVFVRDFVDDIFTGMNLAKLTRWMLDPGASSVLGIGGTILIVALGALSGFFLIYVKKGTAEYLIKTDTELHKVTWPKITPWFKSDTLVWGSTYVVLIVVVAMTVYVFGVDMILQRISQWLFYGTSR